VECRKSWWEMSWSAKPGSSPIQVPAAMCGEHDVVATAEGQNSGSQGRSSGIASSVLRPFGKPLQIRRALIKPEEIVQDTRADEAFVLVRRAEPLRCGRAIYFRWPDMASLVAANRFSPRLDAAE
jgi:type IV secretion system protein VirD4